MSTKEINKAAERYAAQNDGIYPSPVFRFAVKRDFKDGAEYALSHQWRDPKVELPEECERVLVHCEGFCTIACFNGVEWHGNRYLKVLHWMPIPEPPKPEGK